MVRVADVIAQTLKAYDTEYFFCVTGGDHALWFALADAGIRVINCRSEQGAVYMADGYARASGKSGVCMVVPGPGLLNALAGVATAYACSSRVLCIAGQIPSMTIGRELGMLHEIPNQSQILGALTIRKIVNIKV